MKISEKKKGEWYALLNAWKVPLELEHYIKNRDAIKGAFSVLNATLPKKIKDEAWRDYMDRNKEAADE